MISKLAVEASSLASAIHVSHDYTARAIACVHELACVRACAQDEILGPTDAETRRTASTSPTVARWADREAVMG